MLSALPTPHSLPERKDVDPIEFRGSTPRITDFNDSEIDGPNLLERGRAIVFSLRQSYDF